MELSLYNADIDSLLYGLYQIIIRRQKNIQHLELKDLDLFYDLKNLFGKRTELGIEHIDPVWLSINYGVHYGNESQDKNKVGLTFNFNDFDDSGQFISLDDIYNRFIHSIRQPKLSIQYNLDFDKPPCFIPSHFSDEAKLVTYYASLINENLEHKLNEALQIFDERFRAFKQVFYENKPVSKILLDNGQVVPLSTLGEGINRYIAILCAIWASQDSYLFIDEIENGIHYENYTKLWRLIFENAKLANCQVFATSHSKECIEAFNKANEDNQGTYLELLYSAKRKKS